MEIETIDIYQSDTTKHGNTVGVRLYGRNEITIHFNGHAASFTKNEAYALANTIRTVARLADHS